MPEATASSCVASVLEKVHDALVLASEESVEDNDTGLKKSVAALAQVAEVCLMVPGLHSAEISAVSTLAFCRFLPQPLTVGVSTCS